MGNIKELNIKNRTYCFFDDMINIEYFDSNLQKMDKKSHKNIDIYNIGYITTKIIDDYGNIYNVNPLYLTFGEVDVHIEEKNRNTYLVFDSTDENKKVLEKYGELQGKVNNEIETINGGKKSEYGKDFMKIKFDTDDDLWLNKLLKLHMLTIAVRSVFEEDGKFYPQI